LDVEVGRKNIVLGIVLFLVLGVVVGVPLTIDFFGGTLLTPDQYQTVEGGTRLRGVLALLSADVHAGTVHAVPGDRWRERPAT
jgi:hypothetical protein